jgi:hypothetical protein
MALSLLSANDQGKFRGRNDQLSPAKEEEDVTSSPLLIHLKQCVTNGSAPDEVVITKLMDCYPESAAVADEENKQLPLHLACQATGIGEKVFKMLLQAYPIGAYVCDAGGKYPIDYAIANKDTSTRNMALALLSANDEGKFRGRNDQLSPAKEEEEVALDDVKSQFSQSTKSLGSQKSAQLLQALLSNSSTKSQIVAIARSRSAMSKTSKHSSTTAQNFDARSRRTGSQISNSSPKSVQDFVPAARSLSTSVTSLPATVARSTSTLSQVSRNSSKSEDIEKILATADLLLKDTRAALDQTSGSASIHSDGEHVPDSSSSPTAGNVTVQVARSASSKSGNASKQSSITPSESAAELEMPLAVVRPDSPVSTTSAKSKTSSKSETSKKSSTTEAEAAALLQAAASDKNLAEVIDFLLSEYDVALTKEAEDEGDVTATKPKSPWSKFKGFSY